MRKIYIVGIGGAGTSALAVVYAKQGFSVSGSDVGDGFYHAILHKNGIVVWDHYDPKHITKDLDLVVHTTAVGSDNPEITAACAHNIPVMTYPEAIGELTRQMRTICVCGTHGKTTTTALTTYALIGANVHPTAIVGSCISAWNGGAYVDGQDWFVIEADEYQNKLALYHPHSAIITSIDYDHPDFFADEQAYRDVFRKFVERIPQGGFIVACGDDTRVREIVQHGSGKTVLYGENKVNDCVIENREVHEKGQTILLTYEQAHYRIDTQLHGAHNAKNVVAAWLMGFLLTGETKEIARGIGNFVGTARRFERRGEHHGAILIDDYAHHPTEIAATLSALHEIYPHRNILVAFHPHTFTRTKALLGDFARVLQNADSVIILDIYGSARESVGDIDAYDLVKAINALCTTQKAQHIPTVEQLRFWMENNLTDKDVFVTMGAGDIWKVYEK